jgi:arylsulfatase A-like enzyme
MSITRRTFLKTTTLSIAASLSPFMIGAGKRQPEQNVLFIAIDDLNDWIGCLGGHPQVKTPHIDRLAKKGSLFTNAHCAVPICGPSRAALFTGRQPWHTGIYSNDNESLKVVGREFRTLPQQLHSSGYITFGAGKVLHGSINLYPDDIFTEFGPGYNQFQPLTSKEASYTDEEFNSPVDKAYLTHTVARGQGKFKATFPLNKMPRERRLESQKIESFDWGPFPVTDQEMDDYKTASWVIDKINNKNDKPFFLAAGFYRPHIPLFIPQKYYDMYPTDKIQLPGLLENDLADIPGVGKDFALKAYSAGSHKNVTDHNQWREAVACYLACITFVDEQVGRIIKALDESPYRDNTTIVLWGDNGWHLGEKEHWGKFTGWEESTRIPLMIVPAKESRNHYAVGAKCEKPVSLIDLYPTILDMLNLPEENDLDGKSLVPLLKNPDAEISSHVISTFGRGNHTVRTEKWRYTRYYDGTEELYNSEQDPNEFNNLANRLGYDNIKNELKQKLPQYEDVEYFVSMSHWKAVIHKDHSRTELFNFKDNKAVPEDKNVAADHPEIIKAMLQYIQRNNIRDKFVSIPD